MSQKIIHIMLAVCFGIVLAGCSGQSGPVTLEEQTKLLEEDLTKLFATGEVVKQPLTLYEAMARGIKYNLNHRVGLIEQAVAKGQVDLAALDALPSLTINGGYTGRNEDLVYSARNDTTGAQSLPPSVSQERNRTTASLEASWNVVDTGLAIVRTRQSSNRALIAQERHRKVIHHIIRDVRYAYWRAASAQQLGHAIDTLLRKGQLYNQHWMEQHSKTNAEKLEQHADFLESMQDLITLREELSLAEQELTALVNLPPTVKYELDAPVQALGGHVAIPILNADLQDLELMALIARPEMREEVLQKRISAGHIRAAVLETFPGLALMAGQNYDSDTFLDDNDWAEFSVSLTQNLIKLFTLPVRLEHAKNREKLSDIRRQALAAAIMAQLHMADLRFRAARDHYKIAHSLYKVNTRMLDLAHGRQKRVKSADEHDLLDVEIDTLVSEARLHLAYARMQNAYGRVLASIGVDPLPDDLQGNDITALAQQIEQRFVTLDTHIIPAFMTQIGHGEPAEQQNTVSIPQQSSDDEMMPLVSSDLAQPHQNVSDLTPAGGDSIKTSSDLALAMIIPPRKPLPELKIPSAEQLLQVVDSSSMTRVE